MHEMDHATGIPKINLGDLSKAQSVGHVDNHEVWMINDDEHLVVFFRDDDGATCYVACGMNEIDGYHNLSRVENVRAPQGSITALMAFMKKNGFRFKIPAEEPLTDPGLTWLIKLIKAGNRGFRITDQNGDALDPDALRQEWRRAQITGMHGPTSIMIETTSDDNVNAARPNPNSMIWPAYRFMHSIDID